MRYTHTHTHTHAHNRILLGQWPMPFAAAWMELEIITLSESDKGKCYHKTYDTI